MPQRPAQPPVVLPGPVQPAMVLQQLAEPRAQVAPPVRPSAGPATGLPTPASPRRSQLQSRANVRGSYLDSLADKALLNTAQFDRFRDNSAKPLHQDLDSDIELEDRAARVCISYHALQPEKRRNPQLRRHRRHERVSLATAWRSNCCETVCSGVPRRIVSCLACCIGLERRLCQYAQRAALAGRNVVVAVR